MRRPPGTSRPCILLSRPTSQSLPAKAQAPCGCRWRVIQRPLKSSAICSVRLAGPRLTPGTAASGRRLDRTVLGDISTSLRGRFAPCAARSESCSASNATAVSTTGGANQAHSSQLTAHSSRLRNAKGRTGCPARPLSHTVQNQMEVPVAVVSSSHSPACWEIEMSSGRRSTRVRPGTSSAVMSSTTTFRQ